MKPFILLFFMLGIFSQRISAQASINEDDALPPGSAILEVKSTSKGLLLPRLSSVQRDVIPSPAEGLMIYNTDTHNINVYNSTTWVVIPPYCGYPFTDARDGRVYNTVMIGKQCWMKENLNIGIRINGSQNQADNTIIEKYCYNNDNANCNVYGGLYQWNEMMNYTTSSNTNPSSRPGICPTGWHIPSDAEWCQVTTFLDPTVVCTSMDWGGTDAGGKMKETGITHWDSPNTGATNSSLFSAYGNGRRDPGGSYADFKNYSYFWTSTEGSAGTSCIRILGYIYASVYRNDGGDKSFGQTVRCVKN